MINKKIRSQKNESDFFNMHQPKKLVINISSPIKISIAPPRIPAFPASLVPAFLPIAIPEKQITNVTAPIRRQATKASIKLCSEIVNPTDSASIEVAIPCTNNAVRPAGALLSS